MKNICIEPGCEKKTRGLRCVGHARSAVLLEVARARSTEDAALLEDVSRGLTAQRLGVRLNRSRQWADRMIRKARRRQEVLAIHAKQV